MYIVTGVSRGLGEAVVHALLNKGHNVVGVGRSHSIVHENYSFLECDLSNVESIKNLSFDFNANTAVTLINNAGIIGTIKRISDQESLDLEEVLKVNTIAPIVLMHHVYAQVTNKDAFTLVNISSGAANRAIPSWSAYCASKAALNMLTETFFIEEQEKGNSPIVYAVSPGVIDTDMQGQIRASGKENFSAIDNFIGMKENDELFSSQEAASRLLKLLDQPFAGEIRSDLRSI